MAVVPDTFALVRAAQDLLAGFGGMGAAVYNRDAAMGR